MGAKMDHSYLYNNPEFMFNLLKRLNTTVAKNPTILMPFVKQFQSYTPQTFENTPYTPYAMPRPLPRPNEFLLPFSNFVQQPFSSNDAVFRQNIFSNYGTQNNFQQNNNMNYGVRNLPAYSLIEHIDYDVKHAMQQMVGFVRSINSAQKPSMSRNDIADLNSIKKKAEFLKKQISSNRVLLAKVKELNPFINSIFNSLLNLL